MQAHEAARLLGAKQIALFCGAGISQDPPAGLPDWHDLRDLTISAVAAREPTTAAFIDRLTGVEMLAQAGKRGMTPELVASLLADATPAYFESLAALHDGEPNANHEAVAALAAQGLVQHVITTNFDRFLERALEQRGVPFRVYRTDDDYASFAPADEGVHLLKIHGCITMPSTIIATVEQEGGGLRRPIRAALERLLVSHWLLFWGYSGADLKIDLDYLGMVTLVDQARGFFWSCFRSGDYEEKPHPLVLELAGLYGDRALVGAALAPDAIAAALQDGLRPTATAVAMEDRFAWRNAKRARLLTALDGWAARNISPLTACHAIGSLLNIEGAHTQAIACFRRMRDLAADAGSVEMTCKANLLSGAAFRNHGQFVDAYGDLKTAERQARALGVWPAIYSVLFELGALYNAWGRNSDALNAWREAEALVRQASADRGPPEAIVPLDLHEALARAYLRLGYVKPYLEHLDYVERIARETGDKRSLCRILNLRMVGQLECGEWAEALATGEEWLALVRMLGYRRDLRHVLVNLAAAHLMVEGSERARADLDDAAGLAELEPNAHLDQAIAMLSATLLVKEGRREEAQESLRQAIELGPRAQDDYQAALAWVSHASMMRAVGIPVTQRVSLMSVALQVLERCGDAQRAAMVAEEIGDAQAEAPELAADAIRSYWRAIANWRLRNIPDRMPVLQEKLQRCASSATGSPVPTVLELLEIAAASQAVRELLLDDARTRPGVESATLEALAASLEREFGATAGAKLLQRLHHAGVWKVKDGDPQLAVQYHSAAYRVAHTIFDLQSAGVQLNELAVLAAEDEDYDKAKQLYEMSLAIARETGNRREVVTAVFNLGMLAKRQGRPDEAVMIFEHVAQLAEEDQLLYETAVIAQTVGLIRRDQRRFEEAITWLVRADVTFRQIGATNALTEVLIGLGKTYRELQRPRQSVHARLEAARLLEADGRPDAAAPYYLLAGNALLMELQQPREARPWLETALHLFVRAQMDAQVTQTRELLSLCGER